MKKVLLHSMLLLLLPLTLQAQPKREFRASWLTTVWAIDWPRPHSNANAGDQQQASLRAIVDSLAAANMNAVFFQVRGFCDAMYNSKYEPWSTYLTGVRGGEPSYDPLQVLVDYAHSKGIEVHVWLNPYRYGTQGGTYGELETDYSNTHPEWLVKCGDLHILNPSMPEVRKRICEVIGDILEKYDIDGVIFDDYFYQSGYQDSYDNAYYQATGNGMSRANWRRAQVNEMVRMVHDTIQAVKPYVHFGIGPAGIAGRSNTSAPVYGVEPCPVGSDWQYNGIYSDPLAWYDQKTIDYMAPQCYWTIGSSNDYDVLSNWWSKMASVFGRHMYVSQDLSDASKGKIGSLQGEIAAQMLLDRQHDRVGAPGSCWYSLNTAMASASFFRYIRNNANPHPAVVPQMWWLKQDTTLFVDNIRYQTMGPKFMLTWDAPAPNLRYVVYRIPMDSVNAAGIFARGEYVRTITYTNSFQISLTEGNVKFAVSVLDRFGNEYPARWFGNTPIGNATSTNLLFPADGASPLQPTYFTWSRVAGADSYFIQFSKNADFSTLDYEYETTDTCFFSGNVLWLKQAQTYYWRVLTRAANCYDAVSESRSFGCAFFQMVYPADEERDCSRTLTATCDSVPAAVATYTFEFSKSSGFAAKDIVYTASSSSPRVTVPDSILSASTYYFVRASVVYNDMSAISDPHRFRTEAQEVPVPVIISPAEGDTIYGSEITVCWQEQLSSGFKAELSTATSFAARLTKNKRVDLYTYCCTFTDVQPGTYYLRVSAVADGELTAPSQVVSIVVETKTFIQNTKEERRTVKRVEDGQIVIIRDGVRYSVIGTKL